MFCKRVINFFKCRVLIIANGDACKTQRNYLAKRFTTVSNTEDRNKSYLHVVGEEPLLYKTIGRVAEEAANKWPDRAAVISVEDNTTITFSQLLLEADKLAAGLLELGLEKGDRLGLWAPNISEWAVIKTAGCRAGLRLVTINPAYQVSEIDYCIRKVGIKAIVCLDNFKTQNYVEIIRELVPDLGKGDSKIIESSRVPSLKSVIVVSKQNYPGMHNYEDVKCLASSSALNRISQMQNDIQPDEGCNIQFTSGTTGNPKAAELSHMNMVNNGYVIGKRLGLHQQHDKICLQVPYFHVFGVVVGLLATLQHGATLVLPALRHDPKKSLQAIESHGCTVIYGTPTMYVDLLNAKRSSGIELSSKPRIALTGGAPCSPQLFSSMNKELNVQSIKSVYGMTEGSASSFFSRIDDSPEISINTVGYLQDHLEAKVINAEGKTVNFGESGELNIRGYSVMLGYWDEDEKTREILGQNQWLKTGDQFRLLENGYGQIVGRIKDIIIRGGENIYPIEIENFLNTHPDIIESQVLGLPDDRLGEEVCAAVRLREGAKLTEQDFKKFCTGKIAHFKIPRTLKILDAFPKTASGKIQKYKILQMIENGL